MLLYLSWGYQILIMQPWLRCETVHAVLNNITYFQFYSLFPDRRNVLTVSLLYCYYFHSKCSNMRHSSVSLVQTFTVRTRHFTSKEFYHPHFPYIPFVRRDFHSAFPRKLLLCGTTSRVSSSQNTTVLISSCQASIIIYAHYLQKFHFFIRHLTFILVP